MPSIKAPKVTYSQPWFVYDNESDQGCLGRDLYGRMKRRRYENLMVFDQPFKSETEDLGPCVLLHKESYRLVML